MPKPQSTSKPLADLSSDKRRALPAIALIQFRASQRAHHTPVIPFRQAANSTALVLR